MKRFEEPFEPWDPARFSLAGAALGLGYGLAMGAVVGVYSFATIDLLLWGLTLSILLGAGITCGVALLRNSLALRLTQPRRERPRDSGGFAPGIKLRGS